MIFLIEYDRRRGEIVTQRSFADTERVSAADARLALELSLGEKIRGREVVLLEAENEGALRLTHRRFFEDLAALMRTPSTGAVAIDEP